MSFVQAIAQKNYKNKVQFRTGDDTWERSFRNCYQLINGDYQNVPCSEMQAQLRATTVTTSTARPTWLNSYFQNGWFVGYRPRQTESALGVDPLHPQAVPTGLGQNPLPAATAWPQSMQGLLPYAPWALAAALTYGAYRLWTRTPSGQAQPAGSVPPPVRPGQFPQTAPERENFLPAVVLPRRNSV